MAQHADHAVQVLLWLAGTCRVAAPARAPPHAVALTDGRQVGEGACILAGFGFQGLDKESKRGLWCARHPCSASANAHSR